MLLMLKSFTGEPLPFVFFLSLVQYCGSVICMHVLMCIGNRWLSHPCLFLLEGMRLCLQGLYETGAEVCEWDPEVCLLRRLEAWLARTCAQCPCRLLQCMAHLGVGALRDPVRSAVLGLGVAQQGGLM